MSSSAVLSRAISDIELAIVALGHMRRSPCGPMLEHLRMFAFDENGRRIPPPGAGDTVPVQSSHYEPSYQLDFHEMARVGRALDCLDLVEEVSALRRRALERFYGESGARWGQIASREMSLYAIVPAGVEWLAVIRRKYASSRDMKDDSILETEMLLHKSSPTDDFRRHRIGLCQAQSAALLQLAHAALAEVAGKVEDEYRMLRKTSLRGAS